MRHPGDSIPGWRPSSLRAERSTVTLPLVGGEGTVRLLVGGRGIGKAGGDSAAESPRHSQICYFLGLKEGGRIFVAIVPNGVLIFCMFCGRTGEAPVKCALPQRKFRRGCRTREYPT